MKKYISCILILLVINNSLFAQIYTERRTIKKINKNLNEIVLDNGVVLKSRYNDINKFKKNDIVKIYINKDKSVEVRNAYRGSISMICDDSHNYYGSTFSADETKKEIKKIRNKIENRRKARDRKAGKKIMDSYEMSMNELANSDAFLSSAADWTLKERLEFVLFITLITALVVGAIILVDPDLESVDSY
jgi:hypothetical protein